MKLCVTNAMALLVGARSEPVRIASGSTEVYSAKFSMNGCGNSVAPIPPALTD